MSFALDLLPWAVEGDEAIDVGKWPARISVESPACRREYGNHSSPWTPSDCARQRRAQVRQAAGKPAWRETSRRGSPVSIHAVISAKGLSAGERSLRPPPGTHRAEN